MSSGSIYLCNGDLIVVNIVNSINEIVCFVDDDYIIFEFYFKSFMSCIV